LIQSEERCKGVEIQELSSAAEEDDDADDEEDDSGDESSGDCQCLNLSTSMGGTRSKVEGGDRHDLEPEGMREDTRHNIYTGSDSQSSYPTSCLE
jgi:hypothetical protein